MEKPTLFLAIIFLVTLVLPSTVKFSPQEHANIKIIEIIIWGLFALEYLIRVYLAESRWQFIKRHPIEFLIVAIPFLQPLRIIRIVSLTAYFARKARHLFDKQNILFLASMGPLIVLISAVIMYEVEKGAKGTTIHSFSDSLWLSVTTLSTVGYGDEYPVTQTGRIVAAITILLGVSLIGILTAEIAVIFIGSKKQEVMRDDENFDMVMKELGALRQEIKELKEKDNKD